MMQRKQIQMYYPLQACSLYGVLPDNVLKIAREGIGLKLREPVPTYSTVSKDVKQFNWYGVSPVAPPLGFLFYQSSMSFVGSERWQFFYFGNVIVPGITYNFAMAGESIQYVTVPGDTVFSVRTAICALINAHTFAVFVDASINGSYEILVKVSSLSPALQFNAVAYFLSNYKYVSGLFIDDPQQLLISSSESSTGMPAVPSVAASYDYDDLTPFSLSSFLTYPGYTQQLLSITTEGTADVDDYPAISLFPLTGDTVNIYNGNMYFANQFNTYETIIMIHK